MSQHKPNRGHLFILLPWVVSPEIHLQNQENCPGCWAESQGLRVGGSEPSSGLMWTILRGQCPGSDQVRQCSKSPPTLSQAVSSQTCDFLAPGVSGATLSSDSYPYPTCHYLHCMELLSRPDVQERCRYSHTLGTNFHEKIFMTERTEYKRYLGKRGCQF